MWYLSQVVKEVSATYIRREEHSGRGDGASGKRGPDNLKARRPV
jgi:hypothetical protein